MTDRPEYVALEGPTLLHGLHRMMLIEDLATWAWGTHPGSSDLVAAEKWLVEKGFISPREDTHG